MTADSNQSNFGNSELPEAIRSLGEGFSGEAFRELYAEMLEDFTSREITQIIGRDNHSQEAQALANWKTMLKDAGWTVVTTSALEGDSFPLERKSMTAHIPTLARYLHADSQRFPKKGDWVTVERPSTLSEAEKEQAAARIERGRGSLRDRLAADEDLVVFIQRPSDLSDAEKLQAAARPTRYSGLPDDLIILSPNRLTLDEILREKLPSFLTSGRSAQTEPEAPREPVGSDQLAAFELLRTDEEAAATLREKRQASSDRIISRTMEDRIPDGVISRTLEKRISSTDPHTSTPAAPERTEQAADIVPVPAELWHAVRNILGLPELDEALVWLAERHEVRSDWYSEDLKVVLEDLRAFDPREEPTVNPVYDGRAAVETHTRPSDLPRSNSLRTFVENQLKPQLDAAAQRAIAEGNRVHELIEESVRDKGLSGTVNDIILGRLRSTDEPEVDVEAVLKDAEEHQSAEVPQEEKRASADFSLQDLITDYDESKLPLVSAYIQTYGHRFSELYSDLAQALNGEDFSDRDRLVMVLGALEGHEGNAGYGYHISRIRQILKRQH